MGRNPPPVMITRREDALAMVRSAMMLAKAFPQIREQALSLAGELNELGRVIGETKAEGEKLKTETQRLAERRTRLSGLLEERRQTLSERQAALDQVRREASEIARTVGDLNELISKLDKLVAQKGEPRPGGMAAVPAAPAPAAGTPEPKQQVALGVPPPVGPPAAPQKPADKAAPPAVVIAPTGAQPTSASPGRIKPSIPFPTAKGRLPLPAAGKQIIGFGDKAQASRSNGIVIETRQGAQVTAPADGWIVFADEFRSYGQILIINAGDGYHILLAGLSQIDVQLGQFVLAGEPVGVMSGSARDANRKQSSGAPVLYVELRKDGRSIDPSPWWSGNGT
jgi:septal ring factor EnvC (AmiA/AmiB activator)